MSNVKQKVISLNSLMNSLIMDDLHLIRRVLNVQGASQLNKSRLVECLSSYMIDHLEQHISWMDPDRFNLLMKVMKSPGSILPLESVIDDETYEPVYFQQYGLLFLREDLVIMPLEILDKLQKLDRKRLKAVLDRNKEWIQLTQGLLFYYGNRSVKQLVEKIEYYTGKSVDYFEYWHVISDLEGYDYSILNSPYGFSYYKVDKPEYIFEEQLKRPELDYFPVTKAQALRAADDEYVDRHSAYRQFVSFLRTNWDMNDEEADFITEELVDQIKDGDSPSELLGSLQEQLELSGVEQTQGLLNVLNPLINGTRLWVLKGHSPEELLGEERKHLKPLPQHPLTTRGTSPLLVPQASSSSVVFDFQTKKKVGRNDPCPCGSGKKFKKCCAME